MEPEGIPVQCPRKDARMRLVTRFLADQTGATSIEYGLIAAGISVAIIAAVNSVGTSLNASFTALSTAMK